IRDWSVTGVQTCALPIYIIDNGVVKANTGYIIGTGGVMLAISVGQIIATLLAVYFGAKTAMALGRDIRQGLFTRVQAFSTREVEIGRASCRERGEGWVGE